MSQPKIIIYTQALCGFCSAARRLLDAKSVTYEVIDVTMSAPLRREMTERSGGRRTVPQIFIGDRHVGGYDDLSALDDAGELDKLLSAPSAD